LFELFANAMDFERFAKASAESGKQLLKNKLNNVKKNELN